MKFKPTFETELYVSEAGYICIKQIDSFGEEAIILLSPYQANADPLFFAQEEEAD